MGLSMQVYVDCQLCIEHVTCPACGQERIEAAVLNDHLDACLEPLESCLDRVPVPFKSERIFIEIDD